MSLGFLFSSYLRLNLQRVYNVSAWRERAAVFHVVQGKRQTIHHMVTALHERRTQASSLGEPGWRLRTCTVHVYVCMMGETERFLPSGYFFSKWVLAALLVASNKFSCVMEPRFGPQRGTDGLAPSHGGAVDLFSVLL